MNIVLVRPEIAPNTGNVIRLCANIGAHLHLIEPLGFELDDRLLRRAGLDYHELTTMTVHADLDSFCIEHPGRRFALSSSGDRRFDEPAFAATDTFVFGAERDGLSRAELGEFDPEHRLVVPMREGNRSLNVANAVAIVAYEAWRQQGFDGAGPIGASTSETPASEPFDS